jgi:hypothetical protein
MITMFGQYLDRCNALMVSTRKVCSETASEVIGWPVWFAGALIKLTAPPL